MRSRLYLGERAVSSDGPPLEQNGTIAESLEQSVVVTGGDHDPARAQESPSERGDDVSKLVIERLVHLVEQEDVRPRAFDEREPEARVHSLREASDRALEGLPEAAADLQLIE